MSRTGTWSRGAGMLRLPRRPLWILAITCALAAILAIGFVSFTAMSVLASPSARVQRPAARDRAAQAPRAAAPAGVSRAARQRRGARGDDPIEPVVRGRRDAHQPPLRRATAPARKRGNRAKALGGAPRSIAHQRTG